MVTNRPDINQVLSQMRDLRSQIGSPGSQLTSPVSGVEQTQAVERPDFADMLKSAVDNVNSLQKEANTLAQAYERGDQGVDLPQVMIGLQKSSVSFEAMTQVRNKMIEAYKEIINMPL